MKTRNKFIIGGIIIFISISIITFQGLRQATVFFYTPDEVLSHPLKFQNQVIRIGALVKKGSVIWNSNKISLKFNITENGQSFIPVIYNGVKPDMFREGQGIVVEGKMLNDKFNADILLVKHSEEYKIDKYENDKKMYYNSLIEK